MSVTAKQIMELREKTGAPILRVKKVLEEFKGDNKKAFEVLKKEGFEKAEKREGRETSAGIISSYLHHNKKVASLVELFCETDFVARNDLFVSLGQDLAMQAASLEAKDEKDFLTQDFIKDPGKKVGDLIKEVIAKTGENVRLGRFVRIELGEDGRE